MNKRRDRLENFTLTLGAEVLAIILGAILLGTAKFEGITYPRYVIVLAAIVFSVGTASLLYAALKLRVWPFQAIGRIRAIYIAPVPFRNEYHARLQQALQLDLANYPLVRWEFSKPKAETITNLYEQLEVVARSMRHDAVALFVPKDIETYADRLVAVASSCQGRIVLIDREVPERVKSLPTIRSVSLDNFKIGVLAAFAVAHTLPGCAATVIRGPGSDERRRGFEAGCRALTLELIPGIEVIDESWFLNRAQLELLLKNAAAMGRAIGVFAGNDEMAIGCARLWHQGNSKLVIVGCDHLPEIEYDILDSGNPIVATIDTGFQDQVTRIVSAVVGDQVSDYRGPKIYPGDIQDAFERKLKLNEHLHVLWHRGGA